MPNHVSFGEGLRKTTEELTGLILKGEKKFSSDLKTAH